MQQLYSGRCRTSYCASWRRMRSATMRRAKRISSVIPQSEFGPNADFPWDSTTSEKRHKQTLIARAALYLQPSILNRIFSASHRNVLDCCAFNMTATNALHLVQGGKDMGFLKGMLGGVVAAEALPLREDPRHGRQTSNTPEIVK